VSESCLHSCFQRNISDVIEWDWAPRDTRETVIVAIPSIPSHVAVDDITDFVSSTAEPTATTGVPAHPSV
ncbi:MAG: hypothetical protein VYC04_06050, partial [Actinomycetota bacterium]|nr:hypothetical protein [Actinomycetota bacterium]